MIIVTGAAGFIGSVLVQALNAQGRGDILAVDTLGSGAKFKNLRAKSYQDIMAPSVLMGQLRTGAMTPSAILHMGARTDTSEPDADLMLGRNTKYTRELARVCVERGIRFVYASSASVYGDGRLGFSDGDALTPHLLPLNAYAFSKWLFDAEAIRDGWSDQVAGLRFFNVFGPNEYHKGFMASVIWHVTRQIRETGTARLFQSHHPDYADGEQRRDFVYVRDVVNVILWFLDNPTANGIFNLGAGQARTYNDLARAIFAALKTPAKIEYIPTPESIRASYQYFTEADLSKLRAAGCDVPFLILEESVGDYVQNFLLQDNPYL